MGAVETLICWENLDVQRYKLKNSAGEEKVIHLTPMQEKDKSHFVDKETGVELELVEPPITLLEWLANNYKTFGATLEIITDRSQEGSQYVKGFGGIGGELPHPTHTCTNESAFRTFTISRRPSRFRFE